MAEARITRIQTGAEAAAGRPGRVHNQTMADLNARIDAAEARTRQQTAETQAGIDKSRANVAHLKATGRFPN
ncbi:hypothetical protein [Streptomyces sp. NPDC050534]|uniref:hypothetical protein n=1 Tax=Streptomyces sp. NPDC050534 TaxID=3365625 RepID=UPI0037A52F74